MLNRIVLVALLAGCLAVVVHGGDDDPRAVHNLRTKIGTKWWINAPKYDHPYWGWDVIVVGIKGGERAIVQKLDDRNVEVVVPMYWLHDDFFIGGGG